MVVHPNNNSYSLDDMYDEDLNVIRWFTRTLSNLGFKEAPIAWLNIELELSNRDVMRIGEI